MLTTYRKDDSAVATPVWFRWADGAFEVVIAEGDVKLRHLRRRREASLVVFETVHPFRGLEVRGKPDLIEADVTPVRIAIATKYLGAADAERMAAARASDAVIVRFADADPRVWDLIPILPSTS